MAKKSVDVKRFSAGAILDFIQRVLVAAEMPSEDAHIVAKLMTEADVNGSDGHGVFRLPGYIQRIKEGGLNLKPNIKIGNKDITAAKFNSISFDINLPTVMHVLIK